MGSKASFVWIQNREMSVFSTHDFESSSWNKIQKLVLHNMFYFHPYLGRIPIFLTNMFQRGWNHQPENEWQNDWNPGFRFVKSFAAQQQLHRRKPTAIGCNFTLGEMIQFDEKCSNGLKPPTTTQFIFSLFHVQCSMSSFGGLNLSM